ncbi:MAG: cysteine hydrolase [Albidovulum sp.]|nr:cysteine hydrolase [Albidovulum sp.]MDE0307169.1 cysteine hydrolase [Albidovulum sp.]MDE0531897.1 cysteine hydrolase [Albidovulum sp.]
MPHNVKIPDYVIDRIMAKRGRLAVFKDFEASKTALLVIDMQNFYVAEVDTAISIVPNINRIASACREKGAAVFWVIMRCADEEGSPSQWPLYHNFFFTEAKGQNHLTKLSPGNPGYEIYPDLDVREEDSIVTKRRFSPFVAGASDLHERLQEMGIENLIVTGTATNMCSESTARDAMMLDYKVVMVEDANAARFDDDHLVGLTSFYQSFGDVRSTDGVIGMIS